MCLWPMWVVSISLNGISLLKCPPLSAAAKRSSIMRAKPAVIPSMAISQAVISSAPVGQSRAQDSQSRRGLARIGAGDRSRGPRSGRYETGFSSPDGHAAKRHLPAEGLGLLQVHGSRMSRCRVELPHVQEVVGPVPVARNQLIVDLFR